MRPWQYAKSSARKKRDSLVDLPIFELMDSERAACPDLRHRMILHKPASPPARWACAVEGGCRSGRVIVNRRPSG
jgi:hypothetical protein